MHWFIADAFVFIYYVLLEGTFALLLKFTEFLQKGISSFQIYAEGKKSTDLTLRAIFV